VVNSWSGNSGISGSSYAWEFFVLIHKWYDFTAGWFKEMLSISNRISPCLKMSTFVAPWWDSNPGQICWLSIQAVFPHVSSDCFRQKCCFWEPCSYWWVTETRVANENNLLCMNNSGGANSRLVPMVEDDFFWIPTVSAIMTSEIFAHAQYHQAERNTIEMTSVLSLSIDQALYRHRYPLRLGFSRSV